MPPDALILAQNLFGGRILHGSAGAVTALPRPLSWIQGVLLRGRQGNAPNFVSRFRVNRSSAQWIDVVEQRV